MADKKELNLDVFDQAVAAHEAANPSGPDLSSFDNPAGPAGVAIPSIEGLKGLGAAAAGAVQGATLGFGDEMLGAMAGKNELYNQLGNAIMPGSKFEGEKILEAYRNMRDMTRNAQEQIKKENPVPYAAGEFTGAFLNPIPLGKVSEGAKMAETLARYAGEGALMGGTVGLGTSEADLTKGQVKEAAKDTGEGALVGGATGLLVPAGLSVAKGAANLGKYAVKEAGKLEPVQTAIKAAGKGYEGVDVIGKAASERIGGEMLELGREAGEMLSTQGKKLAQKQQDIIRNSTNKVDMLDALETLDKEINNFKPITSVEQKDLAELKKIQDSLLENYRLSSTSMEEANDIKKRLQAAGDIRQLGAQPALSSETGIGIAKNVASKARTGIEEASPELTAINKDIGSYNQEMEKIGLDAVNESNIDPKQKEKVGKRITDIMKNLETGNIKGAEAQDQLQTIIDAIEKTNPGEGQKLADKFRNKALEYNLARKTSGDAVFTIGGGISSGAARTGYYAGKTGKVIADKTRALYDSSPEQLRNIARSMMSTGSKAKVLAGQVLQKIADAPTEQARAALIYSYSQNPEYRDALNDNSENGSAIQFNPLKPRE